MSKPSNVVSVEVEKDSYPAKLPSEFTPSDYRTKDRYWRNLPSGIWMCLSPMSSAADQEPS